jgi:hypothetical protein
MKQEPTMTTIRVNGKTFRHWDTSVEHHWNGQRFTTWDAVVFSGRAHVHFAESGIADEQQAEAKIAEFIASHSRPCRAK